MKSWKILSIKSINNIIVKADLTYYILRIDNSEDRNTNEATLVEEAKITETIHLRYDNTVHNDNILLYISKPSMIHFGNDIANANAEAPRNKINIQKLNKKYITKYGAVSFVAMQYLFGVGNVIAEDAAQLVTTTASIQQKNNQESFERENQW